jgi:hypothetical protein
LTEKDKGKFIAIDIETSEYEIDADMMAASHRLHARIANAQVWLMRVGHRAVVHFRSPRIIRK